MKATRSSWLAIVTLSVILLSAGLIGWSLKPDPPQDDRVVCASAEDSVVYDCRTGSTLDYREGAWYRR